MKTTRILTCSLVIGAVVFAAVNASAVPQKLSISGTLTYQLANTTSGTVTTYKTKTVSFNNKQIIAALNASGAFTAAAGQSIPTGSYFVLDSDSNDIIITNKSGLSINLTTLHFASISEGDVSVDSGKYDSSTQQYSDKGLSTGTLSITDGAGTTVVMSGLEQYSSSGSKATSGTQKVKSSGSVTGYGAGSFEYDDAVVKGKASASGSGTENVVS